jgi:two-component system response regulator GlrR
MKQNSIIPAIRHQDEPGKDRKTRILVVDDDGDLLRLMSFRLKAAGYRIDCAESGEQALGRLSAAPPDLVITDLQMGGMSGLDLFDTIHENHPGLPVIILTAHGTIPDAVNATRNGVASFLTKPFDGQILLENIDHALRMSGNTGRQGAPGIASWREKIISRSRSMEELLAQAEKVAVSDAAILIQSESGTGKELLAEAIHNASSRANQVFVPVNCAAIPEQLLESELFGHVKGAFTGATRNHAGLFRSADRGTIFLDEIGDMPIGFQAKLLRVLQDNQVRPVGSTEAYSIDVRLISATNHLLEENVRTGSFREDLYYRLNVLTLEMPPLRERREDVPLIANNHLAANIQRGQKTGLRFSPEAMEQMVSAPWPGNVRQLLNVVEQCVILATTEIIPASMVKRALRGQTGVILPLAMAQSHFERDYLVKILQITQGNVTQAAKMARRNRTEFYRLLNRHHLEAALFRDDGLREVEP